MPGELAGKAGAKLTVVERENRVSQAEKKIDVFGGFSFSLGLAGESLLARKGLGPVLALTACVCLVAVLPYCLMSCCMVASGWNPVSRKFREAPGKREEAPA